MEIVTLYERKSNVKDRSVTARNFWLRSVATSIGGEFSPSRHHASFEVLLRRLRNPLKIYQDKGQRRRLHMAAERAYRRQQVAPGHGGSS